MCNRPLICPLGIFWLTHRHKVYGKVTCCHIERNVFNRSIWGHFNLSIWGQDMHLPFYVWQRKHIPLWADFCKRWAFTDTSSLLLIWMPKRKGMLLYHTYEPRFSRMHSTTSSRWPRSPVSLNNRRFWLCLSIDFIQILHGVSEDM